jgi:amino acid transporter
MATEAERRTGAGEGASASRGAVVKRILVGRQLPNSRMSHTLLPKFLALPVFAADALSSVAYCVEASLLVLIGTSASAAKLVIPIQIGIALLMAIVVASYRQTVRAYPTGGGSYIVSKDNLGVLPGLIAAAALLTDYVLTVSVSVASGILAIESAVPGLAHQALVLSLASVVVIAAANLRGVRESGMLVALPVYGFIVAAFTMIGVGIVKCLHGCPHVVVPDAIPPGAGAVGLFVILYAFSSGSSALTGVEAISNGIRAFRRPQARNAAQTLLIMGTVGITLILGTAFLANAMHARPSGSVSVVSEIAKTVFPGSRPGSGAPMFYVFQVFTFAILILAANTSFQDFPRLSAILARDGFMPRQFENLGDRLVFSNGVVVLTVLSSLLLVMFQANVDALIQLYVVGVFTAFTLSQTGMVIHWLRLGRRQGPDAAGWRWRMTINGVGAFSTGIVTVIVVYTKFRHGAWIVIVAVPVIVAMFAAVHRHYRRVAALLRAHVDAPTADVPTVRRTTVVVLVDALDTPAARGVSYARSIAGEGFRAVHPFVPGVSDEVLRAWPAFSRSRVPLELIAGNGRSGRALVDFLRDLPRDAGDIVTVVVPEPLSGRSLWRAVRPGRAFGVKLRLLAEPGIVVANVPVLVGPQGPGGGTVERPSLQPRRTVALVLVSSVNDATVRAIDYGRALRVDEVRALHCALDQARVSAIWDAWLERRIPIELDIVEAPFRELGPPILDEVRRITRDGHTVASVILPELVVPTWRHELLHNQRALFVKRLLLFEPGVVLTSVPYRLDGSGDGVTGSGPEPSVRPLRRFARTEPAATPNGRVVDTTGAEPREHAPGGVPSGRRL